MKRLNNINFAENTMSEHKQLKSDLTLHWVVTGIMLCMLISYNIICYTLGAEIQINMAEEQRVLIRTSLYIIAIIMFPLVNLLRYILLRLNQTMPGDNSAKNRYFVTTFVTLALIECIGLFGLVMFILGDEVNSLYIFTVLALLGLFLHRPKMQEYQQIIEALKLQKL